MRDFLKALKTKIEGRDPNGKEAEDRFLTNFREEFGEKKSSLWDTFQIKHAVAACLLIVATFTFYNTREAELSSASMASLQVLENEAMLAHMDILEELEEFEDLTDEDWEVLLGDAN